MFGYLILLVLMVLLIAMTLNQFIKIRKLKNSVSKISLNPMDKTLLGILKRRFLTMLSLQYLLVISIILTMIDERPLFVGASLLTILLLLLSIKVCSGSQCPLCKKPFFKKDPEDDLFGIHSHGLVVSDKMKCVNCGVSWFNV